MFSYLYISIEESLRQESLILHGETATAEQRKYFPLETKSFSVSCKRSRRLQKSFHRVHTAEPLLDGNAGRVGKKRLNNDLVCNLWNVLQSAQIFTFSETNIRVFIIIYFSAFSCKFRLCQQWFWRDLWLLFVVYWRIWWQAPVWRKWYWGSSEV